MPDNVVAVLVIGFCILVSVYIMREFLKTAIELQKIREIVNNAKVADEEESCDSETCDCDKDDSDIFWVHAR